MPKTKTHRASAKRFKITASGKIKRTQCNKNHILNKKDRKRIRRLRQPAFVNKTQEKTIKKLIPYA
jgi:large subunit ribosomal protein L35